MNHHADKITSCDILRRFLYSNADSSALIGAKYVLSSLFLTMLLSRSYSFCTILGNHCE